MPQHKPYLLMFPLFNKAKYLSIVFLKKLPY